MKLPSNEQELRAAYAKFGYTFYEGGSNKKALDLNISGWRSPNRDQRRDAFDDTMLIAFRPTDGSEIAIRSFRITTDPGLPELVTPSFQAAQVGGTAIMAPGQYKSAYVLGKHGFGAWRHDALLQATAIRAFRDNNRDQIIDCDAGSITSGPGGMNIHASSLYGVSPHIGRFSAGCQVFESEAGYYEFIALVKKANELWGARFTYTLFEYDQA